MKNLIIIFNFILVLMVSCTTQKLGTSSINDDVYANPKEDKIEEARMAEVAKQQKLSIDKRYNDSIAAINKAQKEKDDANPYYKDREFKYDDYYDYEYATRVKRFNNNINGLSYYDNYYTNSYWYNQNPYNYGVSVYNGYSWWGSSYNSYSYNPSVTFFNNNGWGINSGFGYNGYNPYMAGYMQGYNNGFQNGYFGNYYGYGNPYGYGNYFGYNGFGYNGFGNPYGNPYGYGGFGYNNGFYNSNNGWGYYNSHDNNSSYTYGPRSSHGGGNSRRTSNPAANGKRESVVDSYVDAIAEQQIRTVKFEEIKPVRTATTKDPIRNNPINTPVGTGGIKNPTYTNTGDELPVRNNNPIRTFDNSGPIKSGENGNPVKTPIVTNPVKVPVTSNPIKTPVVVENPIKTETPVKYPSENIPRNETPKRNYDSYQPPVSTPNNNGNTPSNNGGARRPR